MHPEERCMVLVWIGHWSPLHCFEDCIFEEAQIIAEEIATERGEHLVKVVGLKELAAALGLPAAPERN
jgi:hypothetical protein